MPEDTAAERNNARLAAAQDKLQDIINDLQDNIEREDGDGFCWFVAGVHTPDMPENMIAALTTLGWDAATGGAVMIADAFQTRKREMIVRVESYGFTHAHAHGLVAIGGVISQLDPESAPAKAFVLLERAVELFNPAPGRELPEAERAPIEKILNDLTDQIVMDTFAAELELLPEEASPDGN